MGFIAPLFWGLLVLSVLVFFHEGGHYFAARLFNVRATEFFLGMPSRFRLSRKSKKYGTEYGVTPILLGGYTRICGMEGEQDELLGRALAFVQKKGRVTAEDVANELECDVERAWKILITLSDWASIEPYYNPELGEAPGQKTYPEQFQTVARDDEMLTEYDKGHRILEGKGSKAGEPREIGMGAEEFLAQERSHTYLGCGFFKRIVMLAAGPFVNIALAFVIVVASLMIGGVEYAVDSNTLGGVVEGSYAAKAGMVAGDTITAIDGNKIESWTSLVDELDKVLVAGNEFDVEFTHDGSAKTAHIAIAADEQSPLLGVNAKTEFYHPTFAEAASAALSYAAEVGSFALKLITPTQTMEVLNQSTSVVGISVMAADAARQGIMDLALLTASISMSLGFMNLLPIPPLDGGKMLIEVIQLIIRRPLSIKAQSIISYVGIAFFLFVFVFVLRNDILRILG